MHDNDDDKLYGSHHDTGEAYNVIESREVVGVSSSFIHGGEIDEPEGGEEGITHKGSTQHPSARNPRWGLEIIMTAA